MKKLILAMAALTAALVVGGCSNLLIEPSEKFVKAVEPDYFAYVDNDKSLSDSQKQRRHATFEAYKSLLTETKNKW